MEKVLTKNVGKENSQSIEVYEAGGGYEMLRKTLKELSPAEVIEKGWS